jgi:heterodisulfide reductase subunit C/nitrate reductase gamma subunit
VESGLYLFQALGTRTEHFMFYTTTLYIALIIFGFGLLYKISHWFRYKTSLDAVALSTTTRVFAAMKGILGSLFTAKIFILLRVFIFDVVIQIRVFREDKLRWLMHICIYGGFMLLLLMHALDALITSNLFSDYSSTHNPFMFLRDLFGAIVIVGLAIALYRRFVLKVPRLATNAMDRYTIIILAFVLISGILLEGAKIVSYSRYRDMVHEYGDVEEKEELKALESFWVEEFELVSPNLKRPFDTRVLELGKELHEMNCAGCHSRPHWAFMGYAASIVLKPAALSLDKLRIHTLLWYMHFLACFFALAYLPFSKFFHIFASPLSLLANAVMEKGRSDPANMATKEAIELDACTHCGTCSSHCSVAVILEEIPNVNILPSEKMVSLKALASGKGLSERDFRLIQEGVYLCTNCNRCTVVCPVGISLKDLWLSVREHLLQRGYPELNILSPLSFYRGLMRNSITQVDYDKPLEFAREAVVNEYTLFEGQDRPLSFTQVDREFQSEVDLSTQANTYSVCFSCESCTTVCPVVANYDNPKETLGLLPHQIMHSVALGLRDLAFGSRMLWDCLTCYQCQEYCPQRVRVTDVFYELRNLAVLHLKEKILS